MTEPLPTRLDLHISRFFELSSEAMAVADSRGRLERVNPAFQDILGHKEEELIGSNYLDLVHPNDLDRAHAVLAKLITENEPAECIVPVAKYALEQGDIEKAKEAVYSTLPAQRIAETLLQASGEQAAIEPGDLVRGAPASFEGSSS